MPVDHGLQRGQEALHLLARVEAVERRDEVGVLLLREQVVKEDAFLERGERVDVLHVGGAAVHRGHDAVDLPLVQLHQGEHLRADDDGRPPVVAVDQLQQRSLVDAQLTDQRGIQLLAAAGYGGFTRLVALPFKTPPEIVFESKGLKL